MRLGKIIQNYKGWRILTTCYLAFLPPFFAKSHGGFWVCISHLSFPANLAAGARGGLNMAFSIPSHPYASRPMVVSNSRTSHTFHPRTFGGPESMVALTCASIRQQKNWSFHVWCFFVAEVHWPLARTCKLRRFFTTCLVICGLVFGVFLTKKTPPKRKGSSPTTKSFAYFTTSQLPNLGDFLKL